MFNNIDVETTDEKVQALLDYLNEENDTKLTADDIKVEEQSYSKSGALYHTPFGTYNVLTDSESYDAAYQRINDIWDDLGLESFTPNAQKYDIKKLEEKIAKEEDNPYKEKLKEDLKDLTRERDRISERLEVVWVEFDYDEFTKWIEPYEDNKDNLIDKAVQTKMADWDNSLEWYLDEFGKGTIGYLLNNGLAEIDMDGLVDYIIDTDGRGCELAGWDGVENEQDDFYIYKQDNFIYECDKLDKEEECEMAD